MASINEIISLSYQLGDGSHAIRAILRSLPDEQLARISADIFTNVDHHNADYAETMVIFKMLAGISIGGIFLFSMIKADDKWSTFTSWTYGIAGACTVVSFASKLVSTGFQF